MEQQCIYVRVNARSASLYLLTYFQLDLSNSFSSPRVFPATRRPFIMKSVVRPFGSLYANSIWSLVLSWSRPIRRVSPEPGRSGSERRNSTADRRSKFPSDEPKKRRCRGGEELLSLCPVLEGGVDILSTQSLRDEVVLAEYVLYFRVSGPKSTLESPGEPASMPPSWTYFKPPSYVPHIPFACTLPSSALP